jgi:RNA polymerase sigma factor (TIGR02999 family)
MVKSESRELTRLLELAGDGDHTARDRLVAMIYDELRAMARRYARGVHDVAATTLVHDLYLKWQPIGLPSLSIVNRLTFYKVAAKALQELLIDRTRRSRAMKRGGRLQRVPLSDAIEAESPVVGIGDNQDDGVDHEAVDTALKKLDAVAPRQADVVRLRYYAGLSDVAIAQLLELSEKTVGRDWAAARLFLKQQLHAADSE